MSDWLIGLIAVYGLPALFLILVAAQAGVPMPMTLLLIVLGSLVEQGQLQLWQVLFMGTAGAVAGDLVGYGLGRWGGKRLVKRFASKLGGDDAVKKAHDFNRKWGGVGIFFSRWLVTPLGPWLNLTSGVTDYPWLSFAIWVLLGEALWIGLYVSLGRVFSDEVEYISNILGNLTWVIFGLAVAGPLVWKFRGSFRESNGPDSERSGRSQED
ncbi:MAG: DedA family protein [Pyrinomonadaceae bacterium]